MIRVAGIKLDTGYTEQDLRRAAAARLKIKENQIRSLRLARRSLDARRKNAPVYLITLDVAVTGNEGQLVRRAKDRNITIAEEPAYRLPSGNPPEHRPVVVGFGPAGMFAALTLAEAGFAPLVFERGACVEERARAVKGFFEGRVLDPHSNIQFGEGGAGTFSDGKLNTGIRDPRIKKVLETFAEHGAPQEILYEAKPHIGTDKLPGTVKSIREKIISLGGEVHFRAQVTEFLQEEGRVTGIKVLEREKESVYRTDSVILAVGHSARDTFRTLDAMGIAMEAKSFSVGVRIEHRREAVDLSQYGDCCREKKLPTADYKASVHLESGRGVYTFCMCPGGTVVGAASEEGGVVTNGMSPFARDGENSNAAVLVGVTPKDFGEAPLAGVAFQESLERRAFELAGGDYSAPCQRVDDFFAGRVTESLGSVRPTYLPGVTFCDLNRLFPSEVAEALQDGLRGIAGRLPFFAQPDALLTGPETRSSSPVRVVRNEAMESLTLRGLYPCGEGAGYAGGITSAAVDGIRCAESLIKHTKC